MINQYEACVTPKWLRTAGLNSPPLMRKNTQALTARENPKHNDIYNNWAGFEPWAIVVESAPCVWELATWVPVKEKKRKRKVPANSPAMAMKWFRTASGLETSQPQSLKVY